MNVDKLGQEETNRSSQAVSIVKQLEILRIECQNANDPISESACKMAISSLTILIVKEHPPKRWEPSIRE